MKFSKYVFIFPFNKSETILFNSITGCLLKMDSAALCDGEPDRSRLSEGEIQLLTENAYLSDDEAILRRLRSIYRFPPPDTLVLNLELTGTCNLNCVYCYQQGWPERGTMKQDIMELVTSYIEKSTTSYNYRKIRIDFIGGEPFLAPDQMLSIYHRVKKICRRQDIMLETQVETNGTLLEPNYISLFDNLSLSVTLSPPDDHDKMRPYKNGKGTYEKIMSNLMACKNVFGNSSNKLSIRYNVHAGNYQVFPSFLAKIRRLKLPVNMIKTAYTEEYEYNEFHNGLTLTEFMNWNSSAAIDALVKYQYKIPFFPHASMKPCDAYQPFNCKVFFDGAIGLCNASHYEQSELSIEKLVLNPEILNEHYKDIKNWNPLDEPVCSRCEEIFLCGGKTFCRKNPCSYSLYDLNTFLKRYVKYCEMGIGHLFQTD